MSVGTGRNLASTSEFDFIVVGSGAGGLTGALAAAERGLRTLVLEKAEVLGGMTARWPPTEQPLAAAVEFVLEGLHLLQLAVAAPLLDVGVNDAPGPQRGVAGSHAGIEGFTIGQRRGLGIAVGEPRYVVQIEPRSKTVTVGRRESLETRARAEILGLVVDLACRRSGAGRALMSAAERWASARGFDEVILRSNILRPDSHPFYQSIGYTRTKTQHVYLKALPSPT